MRWSLRILAGVLALQSSILAAAADKQLWGFSGAKIVVARKGDTVPTSTNEYVPPLLSSYSTSLVSEILLDLLSSSPPLAMIAGSLNAASDCPPHPWDAVSGKEVDILKHI